jgi:hypothetical protein
MTGWKNSLCLSYLFREHTTSLKAFAGDESYQIYSSMKKNGKKNIPPGRKWNVAVSGFCNFIFFVQTMVFTRYLQCFLMYESSKMCVIPVRFRISVFFPQRNDNFIIWSPRKINRVLRNFAFSHTFWQIKRALSHLFSFLHFVMLQTVRQFESSARVNLRWRSVCGSARERRVSGRVCVEVHGNAQ